MTDVRGIRIVMEAGDLRAETEVQDWDQVGQAVPEVRRALERQIERRDETGDGDTLPAYLAKPSEGYNG